MKYITVLAPNGKSTYLAKERIGGGYITLATFLTEDTAKKTAAILNRQRPLRDEEAENTVERINQTRRA